MPDNQTELTLFDRTSLSTGHHCLSEPFKIVTNHCWKNRYDLTIAMVKVWLGLGTKATWLGVGNDQRLVSHKCFVKIIGQLSSRLL